MRTRARSLALAAATLAVLLAAPAGGAERRPTQATGGFTVKTFNLPGEFVAPWQLAWIADGTADGAIAFTDRTGNAVGVLDPTSGSTQRFPLSVITSPNGIVPIDFTHFAIAGTGGVVVFDRSGSGRITQLVMPGSRNFVIAVGPGNSLFVPDFANNDLRIIRPPYGGPADITRWALPAGCGPTGVLPKTNVITILCQTTNTIVDLSPAGGLLRTTPLPISNMGAQELRPGPRGGVFSAFNADRLTGWTADYPDPYNFINVLLDGRRGPAVPTVGYFNDSAFGDRIATAARFLGQGRRQPVSPAYNAFAPSFRGDGLSIGTFPNGRTVGDDILRGRNLVGSATGPSGSIFVADATPGRPAIHRVTPNLFGKTGQTPVRFRYPVTRFTAVDRDFLTRMSFPFYGPGPTPRSTPTELQVGIVGSSSSPWNLGRTFGASFELNVTARGTRANGRSYSAKVQSADTGAFTRVLRITNIRTDTRSVTLTFRGTTEVPVSFGVYAQTPTEPCECDSLDLTLGVSESDSQRSILAFNWSLECTGGAGKCDGTFVVSLDKATDAAGVDLKGFIGRRDLDTESLGSERIRATCTGDCASSREGTSYLILRPRGAFLGDEARSVVIEVERVCGRERAPKIFKIAYGRFGKISERRSDLNGNGVADGKEKR